MMDDLLFQKLTNGLDESFEDQMKLDYSYSCHLIHLWNHHTEEEYLNHFKQWKQLSKI